MRSISAGLKAHIGEEVTTLATCWLIKRRDGVALGFTTHDRPLAIDGVYYRAVAGFTPSAVESSNALDVDNLDVDGVLDSAALSRADLLNGCYDRASVVVFMVNWADLAQGKLILKTGTIGDVSARDQEFTAEVRGLTQALQADVGELFSPECRADLGDHRCKLNLRGFRVLGTVTSAADSESFADTARGEADGWFDYGTLAWLTGANAGRETEIKAFAGGSFTLVDAMPGPIAAGDRYRAQAGCDKRFATCTAKFANTLNFRGEPHVPGQDAVLDYPGLV